MRFVKKTGKILLYIVSGSLILLLVISLFIDPIAKRMLEKKVGHAAGGQYSLELDEVDISLLRGNFRLKGISLETDTAEAENTPVVFAEVNKIAAEGVSWLTYLLNQELLMDRIYLNDIELGVKARSTENDTSQTPFRLEQLNLYQAIKDQIERIHLKDLGLNKISFELINVSTQDTLQFQVDKLDLHSKDILIDANKVFTNSRAFYATRIDLDSRNLLVKRKGSKRFLGQADVLKFDTREDKMGIQAKALNFLQKGKDHEDTVLFAALQEFELTTLDLKKVQDENIGHVQKIAMKDLELINNMATQPDSNASQNTAQSSHLTQVSFGKYLPVLMDRLELEELDIQRVNYQHRNMLSVEGADLGARQVVVDKQAAFAKNRFLHASTLESNFDLLALSMGEPKYHFTLIGFEMNVEQGISNLGCRQFQAKTEVKKRDTMWFEADIGPLNIVNLNTRHIPGKQLTIDSIAIKDPEVMLHIPQSSSQKSDSQQSAAFLSLYPAIEDILDSLSLRKLAFIGGDIQMTGMDGSYKGLHVPVVYLQLRDMLISEGTAFADDRVLHSEDIALRMENIRYLMPDHVYSVQLDLVRLSTFEQFLEAKNFRYGYNNNFDKLLNAPKTNTLYKLKNQDFLVTGLNYQHLIQQTGFFASTIKSKGLDLYIYVDHNKPHEEQQQIQAMPQKILKQIDIPFYLEAFEVEGALLTYEEMVSGADTSGLVEITDIACLADNITNVQRILREEPKIPAQVNGLLMGNGAFEAEMVVHMRSDSNLVTFSGQLDTLDVTKMNRLTQYISPLAFESGVLYLVHWNLEADNEKTTGSLEMSYNNLDIQLSDKDSPDTTGLMKDAGSFLANNLILESDVAPKSSAEPEKVEFSEEREDESFPNNMIHALVSGFLEIMVTIF